MGINYVTKTAKDRSFFAHMAVQVFYALSCSTHHFDFRKFVLKGENRIPIVAPIFIYTKTLNINTPHYASNYT